MIEGGDIGGRDDVSNTIAGEYFLLFVQDIDLKKHVHKCIKFCMVHSRYIFGSDLP